MVSRVQKRNRSIVAHSSIPAAPFGGGNWGTNRIYLFQPFPVPGQLSLVMLNKKEEHQ
jgi:hypothetical protein